MGIVDWIVVVVLCLGACVVPWIGLRRRSLEDVERAQGGPSWVVKSCHRCWTPFTRARWATLRRVSSEEADDVAEAEAKAALDVWESAAEAHYLEVIRQIDAINRPVAFDEVDRQAALQRRDEQLAAAREGYSSTVLARIGCNVDARRCPCGAIVELDVEASESDPVVGLAPPSEAA